MYLFVLAVIALAMAAVLAYTQASHAAAKAPPPPEPDANQRLCRLLEENPDIVDTLAETIRALEAVMAHPELGGPGFLLVQFPPDSGSAIVTAQYPNIQEKLYRQIIRQELEQEELAAAGLPEALLSRNPAFEAESGGVVLISIQTGGLPPELWNSVSSCKERTAVRVLLSGILGKRFPEFSVRAFGTDILLSPVRENERASAGAVTSTDE